MKLSYWVPPSHLLTPGYKDWAEAIKKASNGTIKVTLFPSSQLGSGADHYDMVKRGVADFGLINPGYTPGRFPVFAAADLPFLMTDSFKAAPATHRWYKKYAEKEMPDHYVCHVYLAREGHLPLQEGDQGSGRREGHEGADRQPDHRQLRDVDGRQLRAGADHGGPRDAQARHHRSDHGAVGRPHPSGVQVRRGDDLYARRPALRVQLHARHQPHDSTTACRMRRRRPSNSVCTPEWSQARLQALVRGRGQARGGDQQVRSQADQGRPRRGEAVARGRQAGV